MTIEIRPLSIEDYDQVLDLWRRCPGVGINDADTPECLDAYLKRNPDMSFVAVDLDRKVVATALCGHDGRRGYLNHLAVLRPFRRRGIGKDLVNRCIGALKNAGIGKCHLFVFPQNGPALRFWEDAGWTVRTDLQLVSRRTAPQTAGKNAGPKPG